MRDAGADAADGGYLWQSMWILWMTSSLSSHSTSASVSELSRLVTHTAVSSPKCNSEKRPLSNSVAFRTLFKWHRYCGILKIHIVRKINTGIRYEPVYRPALLESTDSKKKKNAHRSDIICLHHPQFILILFCRIHFYKNGLNVFENLRSPSQLESVFTTYFYSVMWTISV